MNTTFDQAGIYFGPDQDNFVKLIPEFGNSGNVLQFRDELGGSTTPTLPSSVQNVNIGSFASISTLDLRLSGDPSTGKVSAYYAINGGSFVKLAADLTLTGANKTAFFNSTSRTGILAFTKNTGAAMTATFDGFDIKAGTPNSGQPTITNVRPNNNATAVSRDSFVAADVQLPGAGDSIDPSTLSGNVLVYKTEDHSPIAGVINVAAGGRRNRLYPDLAARGEHELYVGGEVGIDRCAGEKVPGVHVDLHDRHGRRKCRSERRVPTGAAFQRHRRRVHRGRGRAGWEALRQHDRRADPALHHQQRRHALQPANHHHDPNQ